MAEQVVPSPRPDPLASELFPPSAPNGSRFKRAAMATGGAVLIVAGIVLGILPIVPGIPLIVIGVLMLATSCEPARRVFNRIDERLPRKVRLLCRRFLPGVAR